MPYVHSDDYLALPPCEEGRSVLVWTSTIQGAI